MQQWTDSEEERHDVKRATLHMPRIGQFIDMWNLQGEKFLGKVVQLGKEQFKILELGTNVKIWIELEKLNYWDYCPDEPPQPPDKSVGKLSKIALNTIH